MSHEQIRHGWNTLSAYYQSYTRISLDDIHYGPYAPGERELRLLGEVKGLDVIELGCGGGQNAIVLASWGANSVIGLDFSAAQITYARKLAKKQGVAIEFILGNIEDLSGFNDESFDLILSSHAFGYVFHIDHVFNECARILRPKGKCVICLAHPIMLTIGDAIEANDLTLVSNYFSNEFDKWNWTDNQGKIITTFETRRWRLNEILNGLVKAGFYLQRIEEPSCYSLDNIRKIGIEVIPYAQGSLDDPNVQNFIEIYRKIPFSFIISAIRED